MSRRELPKEWEWFSTAELAPASPDKNGPLEFARAFAPRHDTSRENLILRARGRRKRVKVHNSSEEDDDDNTTPTTIPQDTVTNVLDRGMDVNAQWLETDLIDDPESRHKSEGWCNKVDDLSHTWADCNTPLHMALCADSMETAALLLSRGANTDIYNARGQTPLFSAVESRFPAKWVDFLLRHGAHVDTPTLPSSVTSWLMYPLPNIPIEEGGGSFPLFRAVTRQIHDVVKLLLDAGADANLSLLGWRPLDLAVLKRDYRIVEMLILNNARFSTGPNGTTVDDPFPTGEAGPDMLASTAERRGTAMKLLKPIWKMPPPETKSIFDSIAHSRSITQVLEDTNTSPGVKAKNLVSTFFDLLSRVTYTVNPERPPIPHCQRCTKLQTELEFQASSRVFGGLQLQVEPWIWGHVGDLTLSASGGCPVCRLLLDAVTYPNAGEETPLLADDEVRITEYSGYDRRWEVECGIRNTESARKSKVQLQPIHDNLMYGIVEMSDDTAQGTASPVAFEMARRWLEHCELNHTQGRDSDVRFNCPAPPTNPPRLPIRVIYVGDEGEPPRLIESNGLCAPFCALSYCRGRTKALVTTKASLASHLREIPVEALPKTPKEAIHAARQLGLQYIWIDSLCIIQDDEKDWAREVEAMGDIYYNARLVLCAADADDCDDGLFRKRGTELISPVQLTKPIPISTRPGKSCMYALSAQASMKPKGPSPLDLRAWAFQEKMLCARILNFGAGILHWECLSVAASEVEPDSMGAVKRRRHYYSYPIKQWLLQGGPLDRESMDYSVPTEEEVKRQLACEANESYEAWEVAVRQYSARVLTKQTDRIPAILGLGRRMEAILGDRFVAGVWNGAYCLRSVCWEVTSPGVRVAHYPSWSWASNTSPVQYSMLCVDRVESGAVTWLALILGFDVQVSEPQCPVTGMIKIQGIMRPIIKDLKSKSRRTGYNNGLGCRLMQLDVDVTRVDCSDEDLSGCFYLFIASIKKFQGRFPEVVCLIVKPLDEKNHIWQRVGICSLEDTKDRWEGVDRDCVISIV